MYDYSLLHKISIIIPTLNEEKLLKRLLTQFTPEIRYKYDIEIIISDGGSIDSTLKIAEEYADKIIIYTEKFEQNISQGRNEGAKKSLGDVLIFLNADICIGNLDSLLREINVEFYKKNISAIA